LGTSYETYITRLKVETTCLPRDSHLELKELETGMTPTQKTTWPWAVINEEVINKEVTNKV
jgi:hypothetical protein